jgi:prephenate dehydrogenase
MRIAIVGIGLIGGSMALALKEKGLAEWIVGVDANPDSPGKSPKPKISG